MARSAAATVVNLNRPLDDYKTGPRRVSASSTFDFKRLIERAGLGGV